MTEWAGGDMAAIMVLLGSGPVVACEGCGRPVCLMHFGERVNGVVTKRRSWVCEVPDCAPGPGRGAFAAGLPLITHNPLRCREVSGE